MANLGYATPGASTANTNDTSQNGSKFTAIENGFVTSLSFYSSSGTGGNIDVYGCLYELESSSSTVRKFQYSTTTAAVVGTTPGWFTLPIDAVIISGRQYWISLDSFSSYNYYYDAGAAGQQYNWIMDGIGLFQSPFPSASPTTNARQISIYVTYTPEVADNTKQLIGVDSLVGVGSIVI